jgi:cytochrome P450
MNVLRRVVRRLYRTSETAPLDLESPEIARDPFPAYERLRASGPVHFLPRHEAWIVLGHAEVRWAFMHPDVLSNRPYADVDEVLLAADPPQHTAVRRIANAYFSRPAIESLAAFAAEYARTLLAPQMDAVHDYAEPVSEAAAARFLDIDASTHAAIRHAAANASGFDAFVAALDAIADRAGMYARLRADGFDDSSARSLVRLFWVASTKTTERVIASCIFRLLQHEHVRTAIQDDPALLTPFLDEVMRLHPPEPMLRRVATQTIELGGHSIPAGAMVYLCLAAANRDPAQYPEPAELRIDRPNGGHLAFGHGVHHCIGATLGRAVVMAAVRTLLTHAPRFRAAGEPRHCSMMTARYLESLPVRRDA